MLDYPIDYNAPDETINFILSMTKQMFFNTTKLHELPKAPFSQAVARYSCHGA